jgi:L-cysteine/cystine lyase
MNQAIAQQRLEFPGLSNKVYFNFGGQGPLPRASLEAIIDAHKYLEHQGPFSQKVNSWFGQKIELLRTEMAQELGIAPETLSLTENVTAGCNIALWGIDWQAGQQILLSDCEHPGIIATVREIARRFALEISFCPIFSTLNQGNPLEVIRQALQPSTRLIVLSHVLWNTGQVLPLAEIVSLCHQQGVEVLVDAAQSVGMLPLGLGELGVDYYAFTGHKWWCGPAGVGGLYVRPEVLESLSPTFIGWRGIEMDNQGNPQDWKSGSRRFEVATSAYPQYEGLRAAIAVHNLWGDSQARYQRICQLSTYLWEQLQTLPWVHCLAHQPPASGLVSFTVEHPLNAFQIVQALEKQGFLLRTLLNPLCIRACVHYLTLEAEIEQLVAAIAKICLP